MFRGIGGGLYRRKAPVSSLNGVFLQCELLRLEGKTYQVQDGDVIYFRFST
ncbi:hypothetical protein CEE39_01345 [bacterium (candidate division B38) B3_B38]|nr:MAG: hypothetical protein CEE39_01345 [bacterium (candidate division B38) B3_B38]